MKARARLLGHSIHAMLIAFPIGLFVTAVLFDIIYLATHTQTWAMVSYYLIGAGVVGGLIAAAFGVIDYFGIPDATRAQRVGRLHGVGNVVVVLLFAGSWRLRRSGLQTPSGTALACSFLAVLLASVTAWLGGELVERLGVGVDDDAHLNAPSSLSGKPAA